MRIIKLKEGEQLKTRINISKEKREEMLSQIKDYFLRERDEELGDLASSMVLDFFVDQLAPEFYNQGILDSHTYLSEKLEDLYGIQIYKR